MTLRQELRFAIFTPSSPLESGTEYFVYLSKDTEDSDGHKLGAGADWSFITAGGSSGPSVTSTIPANGTTGIPVTTVISATFDRDMDSSAITTDTFTVKDNAGDAVNGSVTYNSDTRTATFTPSSVLASGVTYTATISGSVKDTGGNAMGNDYTWSFTTETQISNPSVETLDVSNVTTDSATLNGKLDNTGGDSSVTVYFKYSQDGTHWTETTHQTLSAPGNFSADISGLTPGTTYKFFAIAENSTGTPVSDSGKTFTTKLSENPVVLFDNTKNETAGNADWTIDGGYSDWVDALKNEGYTVKALNSGPITQTVLTGVRVFVIPEPQDTFTDDEITAIRNFVSNGGGLVFIADHSGSDRNNNKYDSPHIFDEDFVDASGNPYFGFEFNLDQFSEDPITNVNHTIYPELTTSVNSIGVWAGSTINITDSAVAKGVIFNSKGKVVVVGAEVGAGRVTAIGDSSPFDDGTPDSRNSGDRLYDGWSEYNDSTLGVDMINWCVAASTTKPEVIVTVPLNNASNVPVTTVISATFNKPMDENSLKANDAFVVTTDSGSVVSGNVTYNQNLKTAYFTPTNSLEYGTTYYVKISKNVKDLFGNTLGNDFTWSFTTTNVVLPKVILAVPQGNDVPTDTIVLAAFSVPMKSGCTDSSCINTSTFTLIDNFGNWVTGTVRYETNYDYNGTTVTNVAVFTPSAPLETNTPYTAKISKTVEDMNGNAMGSDYTWSFTTSSVIDIIPIGTARTLPVGAEVHIQGIVTLPTELLFSNKKEFYIQDSTGGIAIYYGKGGLPDLELGDL